MIQNTDDKSISKHKFYIKAVKDSDVKGDKHSEDTPIESFKKSDSGESKDNTVSNNNAATDENEENKEETVSKDNTASIENGVNKEEIINSFKKSDNGESKDKTVSDNNVATDENGENEEETVSNKFAAANKSSGYDSSVDAVSTNPDLKPTTNKYLSLQKQQNSEIKKNDSSEKSEGKLATYIVSLCS